MAIVVAVRRFLPYLLLICSCSGPLGDKPNQSARPPNVVVILADDLGYADVGFQGLEDFETPHIDRLAAAGIRLTNGYVSHPYCSPSRAGLLTGRNQHRFGHARNPKFGAGEGLPLDETILPEVMARAGYISGAVGKWHLGDAPPFRPRERGFDEFFGLFGGGHDYFRSEGSDAREYLIPLSDNGAEVPVEGYLTDQLTQAALDFVERHAEDPFFLYLAYNAPHGPLQAPAELLRRVRTIKDERRRTYAAMVTALDNGVGQLVGLLADLDLSESTLVFFLSDNGGPTPANASDNSPLRATKGTVYEGGVRVPFVVAWPGTLPAGSQYDPPVSALDIFPTAVAVAGIDLPVGLDGVNLMPYLSGDRPGPPHELLYWHSHAGAQYAARTPNRKYVRSLDRVPELYAILDDPSESEDISAEDPAVAVLEQATDSWHAEHPPPAWPGTGEGRLMHPNTALGLGASQAEIDAWIAGGNQ